MSNVCGIISLTLGIIAIILTCTGLSLVIILPGLILGIIGMCLPGYQKGIAIAGFIVNIAAITFLALYFILFVELNAIMNAATSNM